MAPVTMPSTTMLATTANERLPRVFRVRSDTGGCFQHAKRRANAAGVGEPRRLRGLFARRALLAFLRRPRNERRVHLVEHDLARDDALANVFLARQVVHHVEQDLLEDRAQTT